MADIERLETWVKYRKGLCNDCMGSCCTMPVEVKVLDLVRLGVVDEFELEEPLKQIAKRLEKQRIIRHFNAKTELFILAQRSNGDCLYLEASTRRCTVYDKLHENFRFHPTIGSKAGYCAYTQKSTQH